MAGIGSVIASVIGALGVVAGLVMVGYQLRVQAAGRGKGVGQAAPRGMRISAGPLNLDLATTFPGILVAALGAALLTVGAITGR
jgi:hypothetical protein